jgi:large subunit ribosomal protein L24
MARLRKNDEVQVISGKDKGNRGKILMVLPDRDRVIVEGVNKVKRHQKATPKQPQAGIIEKEMPIHVSNVMPIDGKADRPTRVRSQIDKDGKKVRVAARTGTVLDR